MTRLSGIERLAEEQISLRAIAELVNQGAPAQDIFSAVTHEASRLLDGVPMTLTRFSEGPELVVLASAGGPAPVGTAIAYEADTLPDRARRGGQPTRVDDYTHERDFELATRFNLAAAVSVPVSVAGQVWGMLTATSAADPLPADTEDRLTQFTGLVTTALAIIQTRGELRSLADEQAALRSVTELAAQDAPAEEVLAAVARQASGLAGVTFTTLLRYGPDGSTEIAAVDGAPPGIFVGMRAPGSGDGAVQRVWRTRRPAQVNRLAAMTGQWPQVAHGHGYTTSAAVPVFIHGTLWGALVAVGRDKPLSAGTHKRMMSFAELAGAAIAGAQARAQLQQLADEQGALRRVAELVAHGAALGDVFTAVAAQSSRMLGHLASVLIRYDPDGAAGVIAVSTSPVPLGLRIPAVPGTVAAEVLRTGAPCRLDNVSDSPLGRIGTDLRIAACVAVPITIEGRVWGALAANSPTAPLPPSTEERLRPFAELAAAAIASAENKQKLTTSRARVVAASDETRRRLQRDVHDGAQQRLVHTIVALQLAKEATVAGSRAASLVDEALTNAQRAASELRDIVRGILPAALTRDGLHAGIESLVDDLSLPVHLDINVRRLPADLETTAYFIVAEALTNVIKHARATSATITLAIERDHLDIQVRDDGAGGANPDRGSGLIGLLDRIESLNGTLAVVSPPAGGTALHAALPIRPEGAR